MHEFLIVSRYPLLLFFPLHELSAGLFEWNVAFSVGLYERTAILGVSLYLLEIGQEVVFVDFDVSIGRFIELQVWDWVVSARGWLPALLFDISWVRMHDAWIPWHDFLNSLHHLLILFSNLMSTFYNKQESINGTEMRREKTSSTCDGDISAIGDDGGANSKFAKT